MGPQVRLRDCRHKGRLQLGDPLQFITEVELAAVNGECVTAGGPGTTWGIDRSGFPGIFLACNRPLACLPWDRQPALGSNPVLQG